MSILDLNKDAEVLELLNAYIDINVINKEIKTEATIKSVITDNSKSTVGSSFDYYFKLLLWDYLDTKKILDYHFGNWGIEKLSAQSLKGGYSPILLVALGINPAVFNSYKNTFEALEKAKTFTDDLKYIEFANIAQNLAYLKATNHRSYETLPKPSNSISEELIQLGHLVNFNHFMISKTDQILFNPKVSATGVTRPHFPDLVVGSKIIDIKTFEHPRIQLKDFIQLFSYLTIANIGNVYCGNIKGGEINDFAIYFSRHGYLWNANITDMLSNYRLKKLQRLIYKKLVAQHD